MSGDNMKHRLPHVGRSDVESDVQAEIDAHLAMQISDLVAEGWEPDAARAEALRRFGDPANVAREMVTGARRHDVEVRRARWFQDILQDVRVAFRQLRKRPLFAVVAITVVALGISATAAVFAVVDGALLRPLPFKNGDRLVFLFDRQPREDGNTLPASLPEFDDWRRESDYLQSVMAIYGNGAILHNGVASELVITGNLLGDPSGVVGLKPVVGRWFSAEEMRTHANVMMLDEPVWRQRFGARADIVGKPLRLNEKIYTVIGVMPREVKLMRGGGEAEVWLPAITDTIFKRGFHFIRVVGRLKDGVTKEQAAQRANVISQRIIATKVTDHGVWMKDARSFLVGDAAKKILLILLGAVAFVVLIVCANLANLFVSKSLERSREFAVRAALGAGRARLLRQVITESVVVAVLGGIAGLALARAMIGVTRAVAARAGALAPSSSFDPRVVIFSLLISIAVGVVFGLWPAVRAARFDVSGVLKEAEGGRAIGGRGAWRRRRLLVGIEVALSVILLAGAGLLVKSLLQMLHEDPGFKAENALTFGTVFRGKHYEGEDAQARASSELLDRIARIPGVRAVGGTSALPLGGNDTNGSFTIVGRNIPENAEPESKKRIVSPGYFAAMAIPVLRGRAFTADDRKGAPDVVIITESLAKRYFPNQDPIGAQMKFEYGPGDIQQVVGVVGDVRHDGLDHPVEPTMYRPLAQFPQFGFDVVVRATGDPVAVVQSIRQEVHAMDPDLPVNKVQTMADVMSASVAPRRSLMLLLVGFAAIALILAAVGVYAVTAQSVAQRTREIGVRMAIGATRAEILRLVVGQEARVIAAGVAFGLGGAMLTTRALSGVLYGVSPRDFATFASAALLLCAVALAATCIPALRASRLDPANALRAD
jgi:putative ABC transport system permease protein